MNQPLDSEGFPGAMGKSDVAGTDPFDELRDYLESAPITTKELGVGRHFLSLRGWQSLSTVIDEASGLQADVLVELYDASHQGRQLLARVINTHPLNGPRDPDGYSVQVIGGLEAGVQKVVPLLGRGPKKDVFQVGDYQLTAQYIPSQEQHVTCGDELFLGWDPSMSDSQNLLVVFAGLCDS